MPSGCGLPHNQTTKKVRHALQQKEVTAQMQMDQITRKRGPLRLLHWVRGESDGFMMVVGCWTSHLDMFSGFASS
jgi:hypothetical protein